ncbi:MAG: hypothetical protein R2750_07615 [Bacteroidales bacterium]
MDINKEFSNRIYLMANIEYKNGWYELALEDYNSYLDYVHGSTKTRIEAINNIDNCQIRH